MTQEEAWAKAQEIAPELDLFCGDRYEEINHDWLVYVCNLHGGGLGVQLIKNEAVQSTIIQSQENTSC